MADRSILDFLEAATPDGTEIILVNQQGFTRRLTANDLLGILLAGAAFTGQVTHDLMPRVSGIPLMEHGSEAVGQYARFENGLQVCWGFVNLGSTPAGSGVASTFDFPAAFDVATPNSEIAVVGIGSEQNSAGGARHQFRTSTLHATSNTTGYAAIVNESTFALTMKLTYAAIGRWYQEAS